MLFITEVLPLVCIWAAAVTGYTTHPSVFCVGKEPKKYPVPDDCRKYYDCEQGDKTLCYIEQSFDPISAKCSMTYDKCDLATGLSDGQESDVPGMNYLEFCTEKTQNTDTYYTGDTKDCDMKLTCWKQIYSPDIYLDIIGSSCPYGESYSPQDQRCTVEAYRQCRNITETTLAPTLSTDSASNTGPDNSGNQAANSCQVDSDCHPDARCNEERLCQCNSPAVGNGIICQNQCTCRLSADGLVQTFDGSMLHINQDGVVLLADTAYPSRRKCLTKAAIVFQDKQYHSFIVHRIIYALVVYVNGSIERAEGNLANATSVTYPTKLNTTSIYKEGDSVVIKLTDCDMTFGFLNGVVTMTGSTQESYLPGLCGSCKDDPGSLRLESGEDVSSSNDRDDQMVNSYIKG